MNDAQDWYRNLKKPGWAPPVTLFGQVWSLLYPIIFVVNGYVLYLLAQGRITWLVALPFWLNLFVNFIFSPIQFGLRNNLLALIDLIFILATIVWAMVAIWPHAKWVSFAFVPYLIWVSIAGVLQMQVYLLNR